MAPDTTPQPVSGSVDVARTRRAELLAAITALERALALPARHPTWASRVGAEVSGLASAFDHHIAATEGTDGMYGEILRTAPRLQFAIDQLVREHEEARSAIAALGTLAAEAGDADRDAIERIRIDGTDLLARLVRHRQRGADLVFEAYAQDIGGCD
ncbi:MAG: hypothetical protein ACOCUN_01650 [Jiangellaceae bacterium]